MNADTCNSLRQWQAEQDAQYHFAECLWATTEIHQRHISRIRHRLIQSILRKCLRSHEGIDHILETSPNNEVTGIDDAVHLNRDRLFTVIDMLQEANIDVQKELEVTDGKMNDMRDLHEVVFDWITAAIQRCVKLAKHPPRAQPTVSN